MSKKIVLGIVGGRGFHDFQLMKRSIQALTEEKEYEITKVVSGGAFGADSYGAIYALQKELPLEVFAAEWNKYGKSAGFKRNKLIAQQSDVIMAFWNGRSKGTKNTIDIARSYEKEVHIILYEGDQ